MLVVSMSWIALYTFTPAHDRPYINGSTDNTAVAMVFGWNGLGRFGIHIPGAPPVSSVVEIPLNGGLQIVNPGDTHPAAHPSGRVPSGSTAGLQGTVAAAPSGFGWLKLLGGRFGAEIG